MKIGYFFYDESYSGVIDSQGLDVVRYYNDQTIHEAFLVTALPFRTHNEVLKKFQSSLSAPILSLRAMPQKMQPSLLIVEALRVARLLRNVKIDLIICRNAISCQIAMQARKYMIGRQKYQICYDGRGALKAEAIEYNVYPYRLKKMLFMAEERAVLQSDHRIAVTEELVEWWRKEYGYSGVKHSIIPTTISTLSEDFDPKQTRADWRRKFGFNSNDIVLAFAGGRADWQGLSFWLPEMNEWLDNIPRLKLLLLTPSSPLIDELLAAYPNRVVQTFVSHEEVLPALSSADHGILWREKSVTNLVASPTKLSEYLQAGLSIICNDGIAVSRNVIDNEIGVCLDPKFRIDQPPELEKVIPSFQRLSKRHFYIKLITEIEQSNKKQ